MWPNWNKSGFAKLLSKRNKISSHIEAEWMIEEII